MITIVRNEKKCNRCEVLKPISEFNKDHKKSADGHRYTCRTCDKITRQALRFNITEKQWENLMQKKECEICGETNDLVLDHDHSTGLVRGRLCRNCNVAIAILDNPKRLEMAKKYLSKPSSGIIVQRKF